MTNLCTPEVHALALIAWFSIFFFVSHRVFIWLRHVLLRCLFYYYYYSVMIVIIVICLFAHCHISLSLRFFFFLVRACLEMAVLKLLPRHCATGLQRALCSFIFSSFLSCQFHFCLARSHANCATVPVTCAIFHVASPFYIYIYIAIFFVSWFVQVHSLCDSSPFSVLMIPLCYSWCNSFRCLCSHACHNIGLLVPRTALYRRLSASPRLCLFLCVYRIKHTFVSRQQLAVRSVLVIGHRFSLFLVWPLSNDRSIATHSAFAFAAGEDCRADDRGWLQVNSRTVRLNRA